MTPDAEKGKASADVSPSTGQAPRAMEKGRGLEGTRVCSRSHSRAGPHPGGQVLAGDMSSSAAWPVPLEQLKLSYRSSPVDGQRGPPMSSAEGDETTL